jgi:predicted nucleic acid-binding Zn ribbon protein
MKRDRAKGEWIPNKNGWYECSECGHEMFFTGTFDDEQHFCWFCGADMRKEVNNE